MDEANAEKVAIIAALLGEPWCLTLDRVARLTDRQIHQLYFHPRDKYGAIVPPMRSLGPNAPGKDKIVEKGSLEDQQDYFMNARAWGMSRQSAEAQWLEKRGPLPTAPWYVVLVADWK